MTEKHEHDFNVVAWQAVMGDDSNEYRSQNEDSYYTGDPMALVYYICACKARKPVEYGKLSAMKALAERISPDVPPTKLPSVRTEFDMPGM